MVGSPQLLHAHVGPHVHVAVETATRLSGCLRERVGDVLRKGEHQNGEVAPKVVIKPQ